MLLASFILDSYLAYYGVFGKRQELRLDDLLIDTFTDSTNPSARESTFFEVRGNREGRISQVCQNPSIPAV